MIRPTLRAAFAFAALLPVALVALSLWPATWPFVVALAVFALGTIGLDALLTAPARALSVRLTAPVRVAVGDDAPLDFSIAGARRVANFTTVLEASGPFSPPAPLSVPVGPNGQAHVKFAPPAERRGVVNVAALWLKWTGPLGLAERVLRVAQPGGFDVVPDVRSIQSEAIRFHEREAQHGAKVEIQKGEGAEYDSLRDHAPGMDNRFIDWKHSARHAKLLSKEFRVERNHQIVLAFDTGHLMGEPIGKLTRLDHAIHAGLQLGWVALRTGDFVGEFAFDARPRAYVAPQRGVRSFKALQRGAAQLAYDAEETNFTLGLAELNARLKRRALVVLFTEFVDTTTAQLLLDGVKRMANRHAVIFVTFSDPLLDETAETEPKNFLDVARALVAEDFLRERALVLEKLQRMGVHCLETPARGLGVSLVNRYLAIKGRGLL